MSSTPPNLIASGNIAPNRFVTIDTAAAPNATIGMAGKQSGANDPIIGISRDGTDYPPLTDPKVTVTANHAIAGEPIGLYGMGDICNLSAGAAITVGTRLKSDANGQGVMVATSGAALQEAGAIALEPAAAINELIKVQVQPERYVCPA